MGWNRYAAQKPPCLLVEVFFFQAEDGIRDLTVTGVQTCALPIFAKSTLVGDAVVSNDLKPFCKALRRPILLKRVVARQRRRECLRNIAPDRLLPFLIDRKSTRLNSSHSQISYAVFCLIKKKETDL